MIKSKSITSKKILYLLILLSIPFIALYFFVNYIQEKQAEKTLLIEKDYTKARGIVIKSSSYKSNSIRVKYLVNGKIYESNAENEENEELVKGDSVTIKYSNTKPELMITDSQPEK
jgi:hypothetical protein